MNKWVQKYKELPWYIKNIYFAIFALYIIWMLFVDTNNIFYQFKLSKKLNELEKQKIYYTEQIEEVENIKEELFSTDEKKEKFAREKYYMKKDNEDVFIIVEKEQ